MDVSIGREATDYIFNQMSNFMLSQGKFVSDLCSQFSPVVTNFSRQMTRVALTKNMADAASQTCFALILDGKC